MASIRSLSAFPCPRCLVPKTRAHRLGALDSEDTAENSKRKDSRDRQQSVKNARSYIYKDGRGVKSKPVEDKLASKSLVPTLASLLLFVIYLLAYSHAHDRIRSRLYCRSWAMIFIIYLLSISCMNSKLGSGR